MVREHWNGVEIDDAEQSAPRRSFFDRFRHRPANVEHGHDDDTAARVGGTPTDAVVDLDDGSFLAAFRGTVTIVDFWAPWCGPCKQLHPMFDAQAARHVGGLRFARVDVDECPTIARSFNVMSIPTIIVVDADGHELEREVGLPGKRRLAALVRSASLLAG